jgi:hypothetical protein
MRYPLTLGRCKPGLAALPYESSDPGDRPGRAGDCAPALRHGAIIFCTRTLGRCNQLGMGKGILGQDSSEWTSIPNCFNGGRRKH